MEILSFKRIYILEIRQSNNKTNSEITVNFVVFIQFFDHIT